MMTTIFTHIHFLLGIAILNLNDNYFHTRTFFTKKGFQNSRVIPNFESPIFPTIGA